MSDIALTVIDEVMGVNIYKASGTPTAIVFKSRFTVDADGSPHCYHPESSKGQDALVCAGSPGNWWGIYAPPNGEGSPIVQGIEDPAPGFYISTTALGNPEYPENEPEHYVDSERYPFSVLPGGHSNGCKTGDVGVAYNTETGDSMYFAYADIGPGDEIGEGSMLLAKCLGLNPDPRSGGTSSLKIVFVFFPNSAPGYESWRDKCPIAVNAFNTWGGMSQLKAILPKL
jgi:hypothetical protein